MRLPMFLRRKVQEAAEILHEGLDKTKNPLKMHSLFREIGRKN